ncbi:RT0821/Lpp0805 family surface protein [Nisaea sp.]|uniref:RT0821/Lpp0805 family surface protein n=1 Tax=Nisaea sp. TaxID=2024842 RepID=UPI003264DA77
MMNSKALCVGVLALSLAACQTTDLGPKQTAGGLFGAIGGAVAGSQIGGGKGTVAAVAIGTLLGAFLGSEIGQSLDNADKAALALATQNSLETNQLGKPTVWKNPDSGNHGTVTPTSTYKTVRGEYCREFTQTIFIGGKSEEGVGKACRQPDGTWKIKS